ncbi:hypothetical protein Leryth_023959 [Lithospermum erythrorhizon]|nr:hypothetical protein Leryth_023959 [Lithospermum erythrorhizon]
MEWDEGSIMADELLSSKESAHMYAKRLAELALGLGFDGWLINMEVKIKHVPNLKEFISHLTQMMHSSVPGSLIIWYDSVTTSGKLDWQNQLNSSNKAFFDLCDGIFVNYTWKESYVNKSAEVAGDRKFDVYMGIDVFGRGTYGGGQWTTNVALDVIKKNDVSAAIFAPGWVYENNDKNEFQTLQNRWWGLVEKSWGVVRKYPHRLPFYSNFDQGRGFHISVEGMQICAANWNNISSQSYQPFLEYPEESDLRSVQCFIDFKEASYSGGGNITFQGSLEKDATTILRLFEGDLLLGSTSVFLSYSARSRGSSLLGLVLHLSSATNERKKVLLTSDGNSLLTMEKFSSQFNHMITPHQVTKLETEPGWTISNFCFAFEEHMLTKISALCYKLENIVNVQATPGSSSRSIPMFAAGSEYYAVLGHIFINGYAQNFQFPPSTSWLLENQYIKWSSASQESNLSIKLTWRLKNGNADMFSRYNIYVSKISPSSNENLVDVIHGLEEYVGVAETEDFYVSDLVIPSGVSTLKFIIQVCSLDGACQKLEESPFLQLEVENLL